MYRLAFSFRSRISKGGSATAFAGPTRGYGAPTVRDLREGQTLKEPSSK